MSQHETLTCQQPSSCQKTAINRVTGLSNSIKLIIVSILYSYDMAESAEVLKGFNDILDLTKAYAWSADSVSTLKSIPQRTHVQDERLS